MSTAVYRWAASEVGIENLDVGRRNRRVRHAGLTGVRIPATNWPGGLDLAAGTKGPVVDTVLRTNHPACLAIGNLVRTVDSADVDALDGEHAAAQVLDWLARAALRPAGRRQLGGVGAGWEVLRLAWPWRRSPPVIGGRS